MPSSASPARQAAPRRSSDSSSVTQEPVAAVVRQSDGSRIAFQSSFIWHLGATPDGAEPLCRTPLHVDAAGVHDDASVNDNGAELPARASGGLSGWQQRTVADYIEANLSEALRLIDMAHIVHLSPYHFARAFKQSFGLPPHRYHVDRRIARAKDLLADPANSITGIARALGFAETSSFSSTFRRVTGASPSGFRRGCD